MGTYIFSMPVFQIAYTTSNKFHELITFYYVKEGPFSHLTYAGSHAGSLFVKDKQRKMVAEINIQRWTGVR